MKNLLIAVAIAMSTTAFAQNEKIVAEIKNVDQNIQSVSVTEAGLLKVQKTNGQLATETLAESNAMKILGAAQELGQAELVTDHHPIVCMMIIAPFNIQNLLIADSQSGQLKVVLSMRSCALSTFTHPKADYEQQMAEELKAELLVLAHQLANE